MANRGTYAGLQALRAIAAFFVLIQHSFYFASVSNRVSVDWFYKLQLGTIGVFMFFVISGAVMAFSTTTDTAKKFALSRVLRIYPTYLLALLVAGIILSLAGSAPVLSKDFSLLLIATGQLNNTFQVPYWTLIYEVQFYAVLWVAMLAGTTHYTRVWLMIGWAAVILVSGAAGIEVPVANPTLAQIVLAPVNIFFTFGYILASSMMTKDYLPLAVLTLIVSVTSLIFGGWPAPYLGLAMLCVSAVALGISASPKLVPSWLENAGNSSYGLYLLHMPIISVFSPAITGWSVGAAVCLLLVIGGCAGLAFGAADQALYQRFLKPLARDILAPISPKNDDLPNRAGLL
ncbi:acyltransferase (plasmid) [Aminobacter sp. NyZ550]|uniref:acyltransferase family protein n=1 Tax=Aminobacter sp. NyZ550 TaxID=2979870 RepID=UPI0021D60724|nr:acyltransferase [Aminobacter sp. NyZ550]WAX98150.1 acyltransferase [Aminobacter sp. NyZ550]